MHLLIDALKRLIANGNYPYLNPEKACTGISDIFALMYEVIFR